MNTPTDTIAGPAAVAGRVRADIERLSTIATVAKATGIPTPTLRRHLLYAPQQISLGELYAIAALLRRDPREYLVVPDASKSGNTSNR